MVLVFALLHYLYQTIIINYAALRNPLVTGLSEVRIISVILYFPILFFLIILFQLLSDSCGLRSLEMKIEFSSGIQENQLKSVISRCENVDE